MLNDANEPPNQSQPVHRQATRRLPLEFDAYGNPTFRSVCSPESFQIRGLAVLPPRHVIPVIFVPGIMGSNIRSKANAAQPAKKPSPTWRPPNGALDGLGEWWHRLNQSDITRQQELAPDHCEVDPSGVIKLSSSVYTLTEAEARRRGWGEVHWDSYGEALMALEQILNDQYIEPGRPDAVLQKPWYRALHLQDPPVGYDHPLPCLRPTAKPGAGRQSAQPHPEQPENTELAHTVLQRWNPVKGQALCTPLSEDEFARMGDYYYPVWACGYNWLQSNEESAKLVLKRIDEVLAWYSRPESWFIPEGHVILLSHSMGGLVTRRAAQQDAAAASRIMGMVHGVQPVAGAPVVYRRFRAGTESGGFWDVIGHMTAEILGWDAGTITCVMGNAPGPLELLPTQHYPMKWLRFEYERGGSVQALMDPLPVADPYTEIYATRAQDVWWGMVDETLIDPAGLIKKKTPFQNYIDVLALAHQFHETLGLYFHPYTYAHYGSDAKQPSFGAVHWRTHDHPDAQLLAGLSQQQATSWTKLGKATLGEGASTMHWQLINKITPHTEPHAAQNNHEDAGDGTVPRHSGDLVDQAEGVQMAFRLTGVEHAASYHHPDVLDNVPYCLAKLVVQRAIPVKDLPQTKGGSVSSCESSVTTDSSSATSSPGESQP